jgi:hypothetical protein
MIRGSCLCGKVVFEIDGQISPAGQCHCSRCRKSSGTDGNAVFYASADGFRWVSGADEIKIFELPGVEGWQSHFCGTCGSPMPHLAPAKTFFFVPAGLLDDDPGFRGYAAHIFVDSKAPWVALTDDAPRYAEALGSRRVD